MKNINEIDLMKMIDDNFSCVQDQEVKNRVLRWAWEKFSAKTLPLEIVDTTRSKEPEKRKKSKKSNKIAKRNKSGPSLAKDLNLKPSGKKSFDQFALEKKPSSNQEKCLAATYYLKQVLTRKADSDSIYTCFKNVNWRVPSNLENTLCVISVQKGWLDTTDLNDIKITTLGENYVEHDLPVKTKGKK